MDIGTTIFSGGLELVEGVATSATISTSGTLRISSAGVASASLVNSGGVETVAENGIARGTVLSAGTENDFGFASGPSSSPAATKRWSRAVARLPR